MALCNWPFREDRVQGFRQAWLDTTELAQLHARLDKLEKVVEVATAFSKLQTHTTNTREEFEVKNVLIEALARLNDA